MNNIYLDNAATTPLSPQVKDYVVNLLDKVVVHYIWKFQKEDSRDT